MRAASRASELPPAARPARTRAFATCQHQSFGADNDWPTTLAEEALMVEMAVLSRETVQRFDAEMLRVHAIVRRDFIRAGILTEPEDSPWPFEKKWGEDMQKVRASDECGRLTCVFFAAEVVQQTYKSLRGARETAIEALADLVAAIRRADAVIHDTSVNAHLETVANVGWQVALQDEPRVDSRELPRMLSALDWELLKDTARAAEAVTEHLRLRRPIALYAKAYSSKGAGPFVHFCHELNHADRFRVEAIADLTGEMPKREKFDSDSRWLDACDQTCERMRQMIGRFDWKVKATARA
jgi:hypothetical protein